MTLRGRLTIFSSVSTLLVAAVLVFAAWMTQGVTEERFEAAINNGRATLWQFVVATQIERMEPHVSRLTRNRDMLKGFAAGDHARVAETAMPSYNFLNSTSVIDRMQIATPDGEIIFSAGTRFGGKGVKQLIYSAVREKKLASGVERDDDGKLMAVLAFPLFQRAKLIGVGIYERELSSALIDLKGDRGLEAAIIGRGGSLEYSTNEELVAALTIEQPQPGEEHFEVVSHGGAAYAISILPVKGFDGGDLAHLVTLSDYTASYRLQNRVKVGSYVATILVIISVVGGGLFYLRHQLRPLSDASQGMRVIASGDLTYNVTTRATGELGEMLDSLGTMSEQLREMLASVEGATEEVRQSAHRLFASSAKTSGRIEAQRSDTGSAAQAVEEMRQIIYGVEQTLANADQTANGANEQAVHGREVVSGVVDAITTLSREVVNTCQVIERVGEQSESIGSVLDVIRGIAEQTNLLALNAAIEAARAGEQGRGFAVVADEVRTLATRTSSSIKEIEKMIVALQNGTREAVTAMRSSSDQAQRGEEEVREAGDSLDAISSAVSAINGANSSMSSEVGRASDVVRQVLGSVNSIRESADGNAREAQRTTEASQELERLSEKLKELVARFKV